MGAQIDPAKQIRAVRELVDSSNRAGDRYVFAPPGTRRKPGIKPMTGKLPRPSAYREVVDERMAMLYRNTVRRYDHDERDHLYRGARESGLFV
jgi:hypothetical protein